mmetsp:Transcript_23/g.50  ORF Transcript_23/g.50 Transcript_23/m.50 type:complete len:368 (+) Transcript_23:166-1269(+)|eukprot:CAMPEP_0202350328 /NCGR_PEP_ID=MMETSP1126-20121109/7445_1 /ASSEMBLY_ACC=CAM_ASM_000457 /TAXON_ID=3047 /ORGANISM="Dunaliella tertiolecta, Strain CCMP1320" /LENGTH=367 /DNA_ID=CAMNT_0048942279 /DNA_START=259 /DNA_END=1362 /DNA_ORIENTATION=-
MDSTGKNKIGESKARNYVLLVAFVVGLCLGIIVSERAYIQRVPNPGQPRRNLILSQDDAAMAETPKVEKQAKTDAAPPRSDLEALLRRVAPSREVLVAVSNKNLLWDGMLGTFGSGLKDAGVTNHVIFALDKQTDEWCRQNGLNSHIMDVEAFKAQTGTGDNHAVSAMKFGILKYFVELGWSVMLSDVDIAILQNPFEHLYRDSDVEGMTDGFDERTAYGSIEGYEDKSMGWSRYAQFYKHFNFNSGLFYLRANERTLNLLDRLSKRLSKETYWDQTAYNEEIFFLSHGDYKSPQVSVRVLDIDMFMNSKRLFKDVRYRPQKPPKPVMVHVNYHPDKHARMKAVFAYYKHGDLHALDPFPGGSEQGT